MSKKNNGMGGKKKTKGGKRKKTMDGRTGGGERKSVKVREKNGR